MLRSLLLLLPLLCVPVLLGHAQPEAQGCDDFPTLSNCKLLDDFESDTVSQPPHKWRTDKNRDELLRLTHEDAMDPGQNVYVHEEDDNQFARVYTDDEAFRVVLSRKRSLDWHLDKRPYLQWTWRAKELPEGANEKHSRSNDTGGAVYVTFDTDWLGRPKSIKYTYSASLPVGTTVDYGALKVLVVASKEEQGLDKWITHERNVMKDYKRLFGRSPNKQPLAFMMWSDSDTMDSTGKIDFDNILLLSEPVQDDSAMASSR